MLYNYLFFYVANKIICGNYKDTQSFMQVHIAEFIQFFYVYWYFKSIKITF